MIDISSKDTVFRRAIARGKIRLREKTIQEIISGNIEKGDPLKVSQIAGILAVKKTPDLIPMCHPIPIDGVNIEFEIAPDNITATCIVTTYSKTGVEMEVLTGVAVSLLNIWDMVKYLEKDEKGQYPLAEIFNIKIIEKVKEE